MYTFGDLFPDVSGNAPSANDRMRQVVRLGRLADEVGLDVFGVGEHHRLDMVVSAPPVVLAAVAASTRRIRLTGATTVLSTLDPVRVFEDFATLDLVSDGRAEVLVGRGSFTENFPLFGYDLRDYDALFEEKLDLFLRLNREERVTWEGDRRPPLADAEIAPRPGRPLPVWVGVGGTPQSAVRAGRLGLPMNIAILGGPERFVPFADLHRRAAAEAGHADPGRAVSSWGHVGEDGPRAREEFFAHWSRLMRRGMKNRMPPSAAPRDYFDLEAGPRGAFLTGDPSDVAEKVLWERRVLGIDRIMLQPDLGGMPFEKVLRSVELFGTEVAPRVRKALGA